MYTWQTCRIKHPVPHVKGFLYKIIKIFALFIYLPGIRFPYTPLGRRLVIIDIARDSLDDTSLAANHRLERAPNRPVSEERRTFFAVP